MGAAHVYLPSLAGYESFRAKFKTIFYTVVFIRIEK